MLLFVKRKTRAIRSQLLFVKSDESDSLIVTLFKMSYFE